MMSKTLSINLLKGEIRRKLWLYIITIIIIFLVKPARLLLSIDSVMMWGETMSLTEKIDYVIRFGQFSTGSNLILIFAFAIAYAFSCFGYLYSKSKVDLYHSIPVKRKEMYGIFCISAMAPYFVMEAFVLICNICILAAKGMLISYSLRIVVSTFVYNLFAFALIFCITAIAIFLTGQVLTGVFGTLIFLFGWAVIIEMLQSYMGFCYQTYTYDLDFRWIDFVLSPVDAVSKLEPCIGNGIAKLIVFVIEVVVFWLLGLLLYNIKPSDSVNKAVSYKIMNPIVRIPFVIGSALMGSLYVAYLADNLTVGWYWAAFVIAGIIAHCLVNGIIYSDIKMAMKNWVQLIISLAVAACIAIFFVYDIAGYDRYLPKEEKIESVAIDFNLLHDDMSYYKLQESATGYNLEYEDMVAYRLNHMQSKDVETVLELAKLGIDSLDPRRSAFARRQNDSGVQPLGKVAADYRAVEGPAAYIEGAELTYDDQPNVITVKYHLKNGKNIYRTYRVDMDKSFAATEKIYNSPEYKDSILQIGDFADNDRIQTIRGRDRLGEELFALHNEQALALVDAIEKDYREATLTTMANELPVCSLESSSAKEMYNSYVYGYYIYPSFKNTLALLGEYGIDIDISDLKLDIDRIESIVVSRYDYETEEQKQVTYEKGTDDEMINAYVDIMILDNFTYVNSVLKKYEQNLDIECNYLGDNGFLNSYYVRAERGSIPGETLKNLGFNVVE